MADERTKFFRQVFGSDGHRSTAQNVVYNEVVWGHIMKSHCVERKCGVKTARDLALDIYKAINKEMNDE